MPRGLDEYQETFLAIVQLRVEGLDLQLCGPCMYRSFSILLLYVVNMYSHISYIVPNPGVLFNHRDLQRFFVMRGITQMAQKLLLAGQCR